MNLYAQQVRNPPSAFNSDSDTSPSFVPPDFYTMMPPAPDDQVSNTMPFTQHELGEQTQTNLPYAGNPVHSEEHFTNGNLMPPPHMSLDMFDSPQELNRRTLTQEVFDAFTHNVGMLQQSGHFDGIPQNFASNANFDDQAFPEMDHNDFKDDTFFSFPAPLGAPLSSNDSSIPSSISEQSVFPSSSAMQEHAVLSTTTSDWVNSRSSSVSNSDSEDPYRSRTASTTDQWEPGQSVPIDPHQLHQQFQEAQRQAQQHSAHSEQLLAWSSQEPFVRRDSQTGTTLSQHMSSFAIQTPQPPQTGPFKSPPPPQSNGGTIAARRQRPRPAALGLASLRSQSYSGAVQPASPSQQTQNLAPAQQLRRIRSSNVINGVAQGRVMKSTPGSAQRSPLNWTFNEAMLVNQRNASVSSGSLAPPTPLSPSARQDQPRPHFPPWQSSSKFSRQASISELDAEHNVAHSATALGGTDNFTSPPQTPMYHHHQQQQQQVGQQAGHRIGSTVITENTPPQSAPAVQTTFPAHAFMPPPPQPLPLHSQAPPVQFQQPQPALPSAHFLDVSMPEQQFQMATSSYAPAAQFAVSPPESAPQLSGSFANGVPIVNAQGQLILAYPPQLQQLQFVPQSPGQPLQPSPQYSFVNNASASSLHVTSQLPKQHRPSAELFVHEYSPPSDVKRAATPRKSTSDGPPKNYTFNNHTSENFKSKVKKAGTASSSPASVGP